MTTEPAATPARTVVPYKPPVDSSSMAIAGEAWKIASKVASTDFVPKAMRDKPEAVLACILTGHEVGISPMASLSKIHVVDGRPAMAAELMRALVLEHGHDIWIEEASNTRVIVKGQRRESERQSTVTWTMDDAKRAKLDGKTNWRTYPRAMLLARATTELCRMIFPDVLAGISHTVEELTEGEELVDILGPPEVVEARSSQDAAGESPPPTARKAARAATSGSGAADPGEIPATPEPPAGEIPDLPGEEDIIEAEVVEPIPEGEAEAIAEELDDIVDKIDERHGGPEDPEPVDEPLPESAEDWPDNDDPPNEQDPGPTVTGPALIAIKLTDHGITERDDRIGVVAKILEREVGSIQSTKDLSAEEISTVIDYLENLPEGITLLSPVEHEPEPEAEPPPRTQVVTPPEEWDAERWRDFLKRRKLKVAPAMREAQRLAHAHETEKTIATLDDIAGSGIEADLVGWAEDQ